MVNLTYPELSREELAPTSFPPIPSEDALWDLRSKACSSTQSSFTLQSHQRFLRRVLSPDAPTRSVLVVHGTGTGKTCTAIQVAEEYILRPEYQDKKVFVVASAAVQETFRDQLFDMSRVKLTDAGLLESKQCTGRRYLEMLERIEQDPKNWANAEVRARLEKTADRIISEFYEFTAYASFGNLIREKETLGKAPFEEWVHETFNNRLVIIDEAHNIRPKEVGAEKAITEGLQKLVKAASGMVLVLLTATPMYESYEEIFTYFNLFRWNQDPSLPELTAAEFFDGNANLKDAKQKEFETLCQDYVSYVKGENPFTFPFRLSPPPSVSPRPTKTWKGEPYTRGPQLTLIDSPARGTQAAVLQATKGADTEDRKVLLMQPTVAVLPDNGDFQSAFTLQGKQFAYRGEPFLGPGKLQDVSAKFARVLQSINDGEGIAFVYSNFVSMGALLFAMALEEHGYAPYRGAPQLANPEYKGPTKGRYILLTSRTESEKEIASLVSAARNANNRNGEKIRVIVSSPLVAEGVDFRCVRQAHILDPWWNMSRIEQIIGRSLRTCSHTLLDKEKQNCTVYLHVVRTPDGKECYDEYTYRTKVEVKAERIAKVRNILERAAMDCPLRVNLPSNWLTFKVHQLRSEGGKKEDTYSLEEMLAPSFLRGAQTDCIVRADPVDPLHKRPLSSILDVRDELLDKLGRLLLDKPIWDKEKLIAALKPYEEPVILYTIQTAIQTGTRFRDAFNRQAILEARGNLYALHPIETSKGTRIVTRGLLAERIQGDPPRGFADLPLPEAPPKPAVEVPTLDSRRAEVTFPGNALIRFSDPVGLKILDDYIFDHRLSPEEKLAYMRAHPNFRPQLRVPGPGTDILVLGDGQYDPPEIPIGDDETRVKEWTDALLDRFIDALAKNRIFASLNSGGEFTISKLKETPDKTGVVQAYEKSSKSFKPTVCGTGSCKRDVMVLFAKQVDKRDVGLPADVKSVPATCVYCELLAREAGDDKEGEPRCIWFTPEELSVIYGAAGVERLSEFKGEKRTKPKK